MCDRYDYTNVSEKAKEFAIKELNENPSQVNAHIESLRKWVKSMPHLTCPTDAAFLLKFLRVEKFDHAKAQKRLDNFCTIRSSARKSGKFLKLFNLDDPIAERFWNMKFSFPLGKTDAGELVILCRYQTWDPDSMSFADLLSLYFMELNVIMMDEESQIFGIIVIVDFENMPRKTVEALSDPQDIKEFYRIVQDSFPLRIKSQIFYNEPLIFGIILNILLFFMNDKLKDRTFCLSQDIRKAEKQVPGLIKMLPKEYNGEGDTIDNLAETWERTMKQFYETEHLLSNLCVDESKRPPEAFKYFVHYEEYKGETFGKFETH